MRKRELRAELDEVYASAAEKVRFEKELAAAWMRIAEARQSRLAALEDVRAETARMRDLWYRAAQERLDQGQRLAEELESARATIQNLIDADELWKDRAARWRERALAAEDTIAKMQDQVADAEELAKAARIALATTPNFVYWGDYHGVALFSGDAESVEDAEEIASVWEDPWGTVGDNTCTGGELFDDLMESFGGSA